MSISLSSNLLMVRTADSIVFIDPKTSSLLQTINTSSKADYVGNGHLLCCSAKNVCTAFDLQGNELWKQHLGGDALIIGVFEYNGFYLFVFRNKEIRIYTSISEQKLNLDVFGNQIVLVRHYGKYLAIADDLENNIYIFLIEDLLLDNPKPFRTLSGHKNKINDFQLSEYVCSVSAGCILVHQIGSGQIIFQTTLESEAKCIEFDLDYIYVGCINRNIYQIKYNVHSTNYTLLPTQQELKRKVLIGHLSEVYILKLFYDEGKTMLISGSIDGHLYFWIIDGHSLQKKILTLSALSFSVFPRPEEFKQQSDDQIFFKTKRTVPLKPFKKPKYSSMQQIICRKRITKNKIDFEFQKFASTNGNALSIVDPQVAELIEENQKLKQLLHRII